MGVDKCYMILFKDKEICVSEYSMDTLCKPNPFAVDKGVFKSPKYTTIAGIASEFQLFNLEGAKEGRVAWNNFLEGLKMVVSENEDKNKLRIENLSQEEKALIENHILNGIHIRRLGKKECCYCGFCPEGEEDKKTKTTIQKYNENNVDRLVDIKKEIKKCNCIDLNLCEWSGISEEERKRKIIELHLEKIEKRQCHIFEFKKYCFCSSPGLEVSQTIPKIEEKEMELNIDLKEVIITKLFGTMILEVNGEKQEVNFTERDLKDGR